jgi:hypothetical protein
MVECYKSKSNNRLLSGLSIRRLCGAMRVYRWSGHMILFHVVFSNEMVRVIDRLHQAGDFTD